MTKDRYWQDQDDLKNILQFIGFIRQLLSLRTATALFSDSGGSMGSKELPPLYLLLNVK